MTTRRAASGFGPPLAALAAYRRRPAVLERRRGCRRAEIRARGLCEQSS